MPLHSASSASAEQPAPADYKIAAALDRLGTVFRSLLQEAAQSGDPSLSPLQAQILLFLHTHALDLGRVGQLAREFEVSAPTVSDAVRVLVKKGLLTKQRDPADGRATVLSLSAAGQVVTQHLERWADTVRASVAEASPSDQAVVLSFLLNLIGRLHTQDLISVARTCTTCQFFARHVHTGTDAEHHCMLLDAPLALSDLRLDCADHKV
ncbi:MAG: MarR family winged helix-turn-helix transcriptional regulator [Rhodothermales bacterium]